MATAFFPTILDPAARDFDPTELDSRISLDLNDLTECADQLGTVCSVHHCARFLDEATLVTSPSHHDGAVRHAKETLFPHSWLAIASHSPATRTGWFTRTSRARSVTVRYCPACRAAAETWLRQYLATEIPISGKQSTSLAA